MLKLILILLFPVMSYATDSCGSFFSSRSFLNLPKTGLFPTLESIAMSDRGSIGLKKVTERYLKQSGAYYKVDTYSVRTLNTKNRFKNLFVYVEYIQESSYIGWQLNSIKLFTAGSRSLPLIRSFNYNEDLNLFKKSPPEDAQYLLFSDKSKIQFVRQHAFVTNHDKQLYLIVDVGPNLDTNSNLMYLYVTTL